VRDRGFERVGEILGAGPKYWLSAIAGSPCSAASSAPPTVPEYITFSAALLPRLTPESTRSGRPPCSTS
jgi:hypothetical protein